MDEVEAGIDIGRHAPVRRLDNDPARRRRLDVARADGGRGQHDNGGEALLRDHLLDQPLGDDLAALVGADGLLGLAAWRSSNSAGIRWLQRGDAAGVDDPLDPGRQAPRA
jgi:hypothetical protein